MDTHRVRVGADDPWQEVVVDGVRLAYNAHAAGQVQTLVCLHAIGHGARDFAGLVQRFSARFRVYALDWPGQGRSGDDRQPASAVRYAELLTGFLDALGLERVVLVGNSIGGATSLRYAVAHPQRVNALILANPGGLDAHDALHQLGTRMMARFFAAGARGARWFPRAFAAYYGLVLTEAPASDQRARIVASAYEIAPVLAQAWRSFGTPDDDLHALAPEIRCPVLFTWATRDRILPLSRSLPAIRTFPNARVETFRAGHSPFLETPEAFAASVERFLGDL